MSISYQIATLLTEQFYRWELRGRGWNLYPSRVQLEPPFRPFGGHYVQSSVAEDDGRVETFGGRFGRKLFPFLLEAQPSQSPLVPEIDEEPEPDETEAGELIEMQIALPRDYQPQANVFEQFLFSIGYAKHPIGFEVIGSNHELVVQIVAHLDDVPTVRAQLKAFFPEAVITQEEDYLLEKVLDLTGESFAAVDFGLEKEFVVPINTLKNLPADPLVAICGAMEKLGDEEIGIFQVLIEPTVNLWAPSMVSSVTLGDGRPFFSNAPELVEQVRQKTSRPLFAVCLRVGAFTDSLERRGALIRALAGALRPLANIQGNRLIPLHNEEYDETDHMSDILTRTSHRSGMILNSDEVIALAHLPTAAVRASSLRRALQKTRPVPDELMEGDEGVLLGVNLHEGVTSNFRLPMRTRLNHCHILGGAGTGKSTLLSWLAVEDIMAGHGLAVIDPHGDLIETILPHIPPERADDVILFDPTDETHAIAFNPLAARSDREIELVASDFIAVMKQNTSGWGDQMSSLLGNAVLAFLQSSRGGTLPELRRFLADPAFRKEFLKSVTNSEAIYFWETEAPLANKTAIGSILTRLDALLRHESVLHILGQKENRLDFGAIMDTKKIFLARLAKGLIGESNAYILGGLLISRFYQTALARQRLRQEKREPFMLMMDEAGDLLTSTVGEILIGTRKYGLGLTLAHQSLRQLSSSDQIYGAVTGSCRTKICFQVGGDDARKMAEEFADFTAADLMSLPTWHAVARVGSRDSSFNLKALLLSPPPIDPTDAYQAVLEQTRKRYCTPREVIRKDIAALRVPPPKGERVDPFADMNARRKREREKAAEEAKAEDEPLHRETSEEVSPERPAKVGAITNAETEVVPKTFQKAEAVKNSIIQAAGGWGYTYETECPILGKTRRVDIVLTLGKTIIACEIGATTSASQEVRNVLKCLKAGFSRVAHVCDSAQLRGQIEKLVQAECDAAEFKKVQFFTARQFISFLGKIAEDQKKEALSCDAATGKTVPTNTSAVSDEERKRLAAKIWEEIQKNKARDQRK
ncbi:MAG: type IV secretory system conjugative DNA transfer family protein [Verrucomicrobiales bacterium]